ncbi:MAG: substrate-binding domain-containing protein, partial [Christensenellales bacterium]
CAGAEGISGMINVISREDGSGTRGAFVELTGIEVKDEDGNKIDMTTVEAVIANSTSIVTTSVAGDERAIGYISLGSLNDTVKGLHIDGVEPTAENVMAGTYAIARPFIIVLSEGAGEIADDFVTFILSAEGQAIVNDNGYIASVTDAQAYAPGTVSGKLTVGGSSSVTPVMEKLAEAYEAIHADTDIEVQQSDSTTGANGAIEGTYGIGMVSRNLKDTELEKLTPVVIAMDGIVVIVNNDNPISDMTSEAVRQIFTGEITDWSEVAE